MTAGFVKTWPEAGRLKQGRQIPSQNLTPLSLRLCCVARGRLSSGQPPCLVGGPALAYKKRIFQRMKICSCLGLTYTQPPRAPECPHSPAHPRSQPAAVQVFPARTGASMNKICNIQKKCRVYRTEYEIFTQLVDIPYPFLSC